MKYPRLGSWIPPKKTSDRVCVLCAAIPAGLQRIEYPKFRGDDESLPICKLCCINRKPEILQRAVKVS